MLSANIPHCRPGRRLAECGFQVIRTTSAMAEAVRANDFLPTGTVTFLFTDIEGSTRLWETRQPAMQQALAQHDAIIRHAIESNSGYLVKTTGDGAHAAFAIAADALAAAIAAQRALTDHAWGEAGIKSRMALHSGAAEQRDADYYGPALNRAARLMSAGHGGQILLSLATMELVRDHLPAKTALRDLGERRLKDLIRPERVYQVVVPGLPAEFPALKTLDARPNNLPAQTTPLIGREQEIRAVKEKLSENKVRLLTLTGVGGTGKTRLALQVAADMVDDFEHGVFFVQLAALSDPAFVLPTIAHALGVVEAGGRPLKELLQDNLSDKRMLLVLDNFEQVIESASAVSDLLAAAPRLKVLVTSRELLQLSGEHVYPVPTLTVPDPKRMPSLAALTQYEAVALFIDRALMVNPSFRVTNENAPAIAEICYQLDGLPLAIELAAARVRVLPPPQMLAELGDRLRFLKGGARDRPARQQTLRGAVDWSHDLLRPEEQTLFRRLAVFVGGCTLEAIDRVCNAEHDSNVLDKTESLVAKNLLKQTEALGELRVAMLETIREYAVERLHSAGDEQQVRDAHRDYFLGFVEEARPQLYGPKQASWLQRLEAEYDNVRAALEHSFAAADPEDALRFCGALDRLWRTRGHLSEGRAWCVQALRKPGERARTLARADALGTAGSLAYHQGDYPVARHHHEESLAIGRELGDRKGIASSLHCIGNVALAEGDHASAQKLYEESLAIKRELGDQVQIAGGLNNLGMMAWLRGDLTLAQNLLEETLAMVRELGDRNGVAGTQGNLGGMALDQGDVATAQARFEECLAIGRELGDQFGIAKSLSCLGSVASERGDFALARTLNEESLAISRELGNQPAVADTLRSLGNVTYEQGEYPTSRVRFEESLAIWRKLDNKWGIWQSLAGLAALDSVEGSVLRAARIWGAAERLWEEIGSPGPPTPSDGPRYDGRVSAARAAMGDDATFDRAWREGRELAIESALRANGEST